MIDWRLIVDKHGRAVWETVCRLLGNQADAGDCFRETFISALAVSKEQYIRNFSALLARLATSQAIERLRERYRHSNLREEAVDLIVVPNLGPGPIEEVQVQELTGRLRKALSQLSPQEAQVFCMHFLNDISCRQIAKELDLQTNTVEALLHRARRKVQDFLEVTR